MALSLKIWPKKIPGVVLKHADPTWQFLALQLLYPSSLFPRSFSAKGPGPPAQTARASPAEPPPRDQRAPFHLVTHAVPRPEPPRPDVKRCRSRTEGRIGTIINGFSNPRMRSLESSSFGFGSIESIPVLNLMIHQHALGCGFQPNPYTGTLSQNNGALHPHS